MHQQREYHESAMGDRWAAVGNNRLSNSWRVLNVRGDVLGISPSPDTTESHHNVAEIKELSATHQAIWAWPDTVATIAIAGMSSTTWERCQAKARQVVASKTPSLDQSLSVGLGPDSACALVRSGGLLYPVVCGPKWSGPCFKYPSGLGRRGL
jgi:hypothetical protein